MYDLNIKIFNAEMGQMVCGSCRHLLSYPRGARYVECACCLVENYVLEEHEVGQVVCGSCNVLLMYPYGAPKVRCATCRAETEIGVCSYLISYFWTR
ncbi:putative transcription factor Znf-LSD family [Helianthus debilis subsp. tardiflorus]